MVYKRRNTMVNKGLRKFQRRFRKRYVQRKGGLRFGKLARDVARIKSALNTERKFSETDITSSPTAAAPTLDRINTPDVQGTNSVQRTGAKVRATHLSMKGRFTYTNYGDKQSNARAVLYVIWLKNGEFAADFESNFASYILNHDLNNEFSPLARFNKTKYNSWIATYKKQITMSDLIPLNQVAMGLPTDTNNNDSLNTLGRAGQTKHYYFECNKRINVPIEWNNVLSLTGDTDEIARMVPYVFCITDSPGQSTPSGTAQPDSVLNDKVSFNLNVRLTYVDN